MNTGDWRYLSPLYSQKLGYKIGPWNVADVAAVISCDTAFVI